MELVIRDSCPDSELLGAMSYIFLMKGNVLEVPTYNSLRWWTGNDPTGEDS